MLTTKDERFVPIAKQDIAFRLLMSNTLPEAYHKTEKFLRSMVGDTGDKVRFSPTAVIDSLKGSEVFKVTSKRANETTCKIEVYTIGVVEINFDTDTFTILENNI